MSRVIIYERTGNVYRDSGNIEDPTPETIKVIESISQIVRGCDADFFDRLAEKDNTPR